MSGYYPPEMPGSMPYDMPPDFAIRVYFGVAHSQGEADWEIFASLSEIHCGDTRKWRAEAVPRFRARIARHTDPETLNWLKRVELSAEMVEAWRPPNFGPEDFILLYDVFRRENFMSLPPNVDPPKKVWDSGAPCFSIEATVDGAHTKCMSEWPIADEHHPPLLAFRRIWDYCVKVFAPPQRGRP